MKKLKHKGLVLAGIAAFCCIWHPPNVLAGNGDFDFDLDVDWDDFAYWAGCMGGQGGYVDPWSSCAVFDFDADRVSRANSRGGRELLLVGVAGTQEFWKKIRRGLDSPLGRG